MYNVHIEEYAIRVVNIYCFEGARCNYVSRELTNRTEGGREGEKNPLNSKVISKDEVTEQMIMSVRGRS